MNRFIETNKTKIIIIAAVLILVVSGVWGYNSYTNNGMFEKIWSFTKQSTTQQVQKPLLLKSVQVEKSDPFVGALPSPAQLETVDTFLDLIFKYIDKILSSLATLFGLFVLYKEMKKGRRKA